MTNCEALASQGTVPESPYFVVPTLFNHGIEYAWATWDQTPGDEANLFHPTAPQQRRPVLFRHASIDAHGDTPLWLFPSLWRSISLDRLLQMYDEATLDQLEAEQGLHIGHTYLDLHLPPDERRADRTLLDPLRDPDTGKIVGYQIKDEADALFARWQARQDRGSLWVAGIAAIGDHLVAMDAVRLHHEPDAVRIENPTPSPILGASFLLPGVTGRLTINDEDLPSEQVETHDNGQRFWIDLLPHATVRIAVKGPERMLLLADPHFVRDPPTP
jgi:hypothetical protein